LVSYLRSANGQISPSDSAMMYDEGSNKVIWSLLKSLEEPKRLM